MRRSSWPMPLYLMCAARTRDSRKMRQRRNLRGPLALAPGAMPWRAARAQTSATMRSMRLEERTRQGMRLSLHIRRNCPQLMPPSGFSTPSDMSL